MDSVDSGFYYVKKEKRGCMVNLYYHKHFGFFDIIKPRSKEKVDPVFKDLKSHAKQVLATLFLYFNSYIGFAFEKYLGGKIRYETLNF